MSQEAIRNQLVEEGLALLKQPRRRLEFAAMPEADELISDIEGCPHAFVVACLMDRRTKAELAWRIPHRIREKLGTFDFWALECLSPQEIENLMTKPEPLHTYSNMMSTNLWAAIALIRERYAGRADRIWSGSPPSAAVVARFLEFRGAGPKIATMAANLLACHCKVPFGDYYSVDISLDTHVRRVFSRLGFVRQGASDCEFIYRARALHPEFPGIIDFPMWQLGRSHCHQRGPACDACRFGDLCPSARKEPGPQTSS